MSPDETGSHGEVDSRVPWFIREELRFYEVSCSSLESPSKYWRRYEIVTNFFKASLGICVFHWLTLYVVPFYNRSLAPEIASIFPPPLLPVAAEGDVAVPVQILIPALIVLVISAIGLLQLRLGFGVLHIQVQIKILAAVRAFYFHDPLNRDFHTMFARPNWPAAAQAHAIRTFRRQVGVLAEDIAVASRKLSGGFGSQPILGSDDLAVVIMWAADKPWEYRRRRIMLTACTAYLSALHDNDVLDRVTLDLPDDLVIEKPRPLRSGLKRVQLFLRDRALWIGFVAGLAVLTIEISIDVFKGLFP